jgi:hypothetical protein
MTASEIEDFNDLLSDAEMNASTDWELEFTGSMRAHYKKYGDDTYVSAKQLHHLEKIANV